MYPVVINVVPTNKTFQKVNFQKSLADVIQMNFSTICPKSECLHYLSPLEFFFYCCCEKDFEKCAYSDDDDLLSYASVNAEVWMKQPEIRSFQKVEVRSMDDGEKFVTTAIYGRPWVYRKFIYSMPIGT